MRYSQLKSPLFEDIKQTIVLQAYRNCQNTIKEFVKGHLPEFKRMAVPAELLVDLDLLNHDYEQIDFSSSKYDKLSNKISNLKDEIYNAAYGFKFDLNVTDQWIRNLLDQIELTLESTIKDSIQAKYGTIEKYNWDQESFNDIVKKNLYFLQHILVHIDTAGTKYNQPVTSGGYFRQTVVRHHGDFDLERAKDIDFSNYYTSGIKIYASKDKIWHMLRRQLLDQLQVQLYGEIISEPSHDETVEYFLKSILGTFVHEYVHLIQYVERSISQAKNPRMIGHGMTYVPTPGVARGRRQRKTNNDYRWVRAGKRGASDRLGGDTLPTQAQYENYFGTSHEIEAHAANAASDMVQEFLDQEQKRRWRTPNERDFQINLNNFIDQSIENLKYGYASYTGSLGDYYRFIKDRIVQVDQEVGMPLPKADIMHRKVWRIFITKLVKALQAYKKPVPKAPWED